MANRLAAQGRLCALLRQIFISTLQDHDLNYDISSMASNARFITNAYLAHVCYPLPCVPVVPDVDSNFYNANNLSRPNLK